MPPTDKAVRIRVSDAIGTYIEHMAVREHRHPSAQMLYIIDVAIADWEYLQQRDASVPHVPESSDVVAIDAQEKSIAGRWPLPTIRLIEGMARSSHRSFNGQVEYIVELGLRYWDAVLERALARKRDEKNRGDAKTPLGSGALVRLS